MHPILFRIPLPNANLPLAWIPLIITLIAVIVAIAKMAGQEKDRAGAAVSGVIAAVGVVAFGVLKARGYAESINVARIPIYSYGVMLGLSLVVGWYLTLGLAERDGLPKETMANNYVVTAIAAVVGSRVLYILTNLNEFDSLASMFAMRKGGLVAYGGFLGGLAGSYFFLRRHKIPLLPWADVAVPSLASGLLITRIGCYLFGCDFGQPLKDGAPGFLKKLGTFPRWPEGTLDAGSGSPAWVQHVKERGLSPTSTESLPVHPTQLYESLVGFLLLALLLWARRKQKFRGEIFFLFAFAYGVARFLLEMLRDDAERGSIPPALPEHVLLPLCLAIFAVAWIIGFSKAITNVTFQRLTQVLAFVPAILVYLSLRPETFAASANTQLSTSQFIALSSGVAASIAFAVFYKAALAHPKQAMALGLPAEFLPEGSAPKADEDDADDEDDEEERAPVKRASAKKTAKKSAKKKAKPKPVEIDDENDEEERAPKGDDEAEGNATARKQDKAEDEGAPSDPEPAKVS
ncbi:Prolipoprotein diacylglyceryl transferase [Minicystis rosea]|nr:Prolipoprotein diacylglyceryl transferase [Minicystis rosea]